MVGALRPVVLPGELDVITVVWFGLNVIGAVAEF
jgi:hypothetical protein